MKRDLWSQYYSQLWEVFQSERRQIWEKNCKSRCSRFFNWANALFPILFIVPQSMVKYVNLSSLPKAFDGISVISRESNQIDFASINLLRTSNIELSGEVNWIFRSSIEEVIKSVVLNAFLCMVFNFEQSVIWILSKVMSLNVFSFNSVMKTFSK